METAPRFLSSGNCWCDVAGVAASGACMVHCLAMPLVISYLPLLGLSWLADHRVHQWMAAACAVAAFSAFVPGYRRHRRIAPFVLGATGTGLLTWAALSGPSGCCSACAPDRAGETCLAGSVKKTGCNPTADKAPSHQSLELDRDAIIDATYLTPFGGCLLVVGHLANVRRRTCCTKRRRASRIVVESERHST